METTEVNYRYKRNQETKTAETMGTRTHFKPKVHYQTQETCNKTGQTLNFKTLTSLMMYSISMLRLNT